MFAVSRINPCRVSLARTRTAMGSERARANLQTRLTECARLALLPGCTSHRSGSSLPGFGLLWVDVAAPVRPLYRRSAPPAV